MAEASRDKSLVQEQMEDNAILRIWTQKNGLIVRPAYGIDKLCFSIIEKGAGGKGNSFDVYAECLKDGASCIDDWAYDILHDRRFERVMAEELKSGQKYPATYKIVTGNNGQKSVGIANAQKGGYVINVVSSKDGKAVYANVPVSFHDLRKLAERYVVSYSARKKELERIRIEAAEKASAWHKKAEAAAIAEDTTPVVPDESSDAIATTTATPSGETPNESAKEDTSEQVQAESSDRIYVIQSNGCVKQTGHVHYLPVKSLKGCSDNIPEGTCFTLCFEEGKMASILPKWDVFKEGAAGSGVCLKFRGSKPENGRVFFIEKVS